MSSMIMDLLGGRGYDVDNPVVSEIVAAVEDRKFPGHTHKYLAALVITTLGLCKGEIALEKREPPIEKWPKNVITQLMEIAHIVTRYELESCQLDDVAEDGQWEFFPYHTGFMALEEEAYLELVARGIVED